MSSYVYSVSLDELGMMRSFAESEDKVFLEKSVNDRSAFDELLNICSLNDYIKVHSLKTFGTGIDEIYGNIEKIIEKGAIIRFYSTNWTITGNLKDEISSSMLRMLFACANIDRSNKGLPDRKGMPVYHPLFPPNK